RCRAAPAAHRRPAPRAASCPALRIRTGTQTPGLERRDRAALPRRRTRGRGPVAARVFARVAAVVAHDVERSVAALAGDRRERADQVRDVAAIEDGSDVENPARA